MWFIHNFLFCCCYRCMGECVYSVLVLLLLLLLLLHLLGGWNSSAHCCRAVEYRVASPAICYYTDLWICEPIFFYWICPAYYLDDSYFDSVVSLIWCATGRRQRHLTRQFDCIQSHLEISRLHWQLIISWCPPINCWITASLPITSS